MLAGEFMNAAGAGCWLSMQCHSAAITRFSNGPQRPWFVTLTDMWPITWIILSHNNINIYRGASSRIEYITGFAVPSSVSWVAGACVPANTVQTCPVQARIRCTIVDICKRHSTHALLTASLWEISPRTSCHVREEPTINTLGQDVPTWWQVSSFTRCTFVDAYCLLN